jgi:hypothetical protein
MYNFLISYPGFMSNPELSYTKNIMTEKLNKRIAIIYIHHHSLPDNCILVLGTEK